MTREEESEWLGQLDQDTKNYRVVYKLARGYEKDGRHAEAVKYYVLYMKGVKEDRVARESLGWMVFNRLKELDGGSEEYKKTLVSYLAKTNEWLKGGKKPSKLASCLLQQFTKMVKGYKRDVPWEVAKSYLKYVEGWGVENLQEEDYAKASKPDGTEWPSLCQCVVKCVFRCVDVVTRERWVPEYAWCADFIEAQIARYPEETWFAYYVGRLKVLMGRPAEARAYVLSMAKGRMGQFWVWQGLADTFPEEWEMQVSCLCRALMCPTQDAKYLVGVHGMLGDLWREHGRDAEAMREYVLEDELRKSAGWKPKWRDSGYRAWAGGVVASISNQSLYRELSCAAEEMVINELEHMDAVIVRRFTSKEGEQMVVMMYTNESGVNMETLAPAKRLRSVLSGEEGQPIRIWFDTKGEYQVVRKAVLREGVPWEGVSRSIGIVTYRDESKELLVVQVGLGAKASCEDSDSVCLKMDATSRDIRVGELVRMIVSEGKVLHGYCVERCAAPEVLPAFVKRVEGTLRKRENQSYGFLDDMFVLPSLLGGMQDGERAKGLAVYLLDRVKKERLWRMVTLEKSVE